MLENINKLSVVIPYYNKRKCFFSTHLKYWKKVPSIFLEKIEFIIVDDCSPVPLEPLKDIPVNLKVFRIKEDIPWNCAGADNLGMREATSDWVLRMDFDYIFTSQSCRLFNLTFDSEVIYRPYVRQHSGKVIKSKNPNLFLIKKEVFWRSGGYDEDFSGNYGYADSFLDACIKPYIKKRVDIDGFHVQFFSKGESNQSKFRKTQNLNLLNLKNAGIVPRNTNILNFEYEKIYETSCIHR